MAKNNMKVDLKKYISPEEKVKRSFIFSCTILIILTFIIFITYSYFIEDSGNIEMGNLHAAVPELEIKDKKIVENTNGHQAIYTIKNNSNTNTYSYNLNYSDSLSGIYGKIYYKIPSKEYSHAKGIIKPNEEKKIYLVTDFTDPFEFLLGENSSWKVQLLSGYEYTIPSVGDGYYEIKYSPLSSSTQLIEMKGGNSNTKIFPSEFGAVDYVNDNTNFYLFGSYDQTFLPFIFKLSNGGYVNNFDNGEVKADPDNNASYSLYNDYNTPHTYPFDVYAEDGTFIKTYYLETGITALSKLKFRQQYKIGDSLIFEAKYSNGAPKKFNISGYSDGVLYNYMDVEFLKGNSILYYPHSHYPVDLEFGLAFNDMQSNCVSYPEVPETTISIPPPYVKSGSTNSLYVNICSSGGIDIVVAKYDITFSYS